MRHFSSKSVSAYAFILGQANLGRVSFLVSFEIGFHGFEVVLVPALLIIGLIIGYLAVRECELTAQGVVRF
jgi:hypothetical protein